MARKYGPFMDKEGSSESVEEYMETFIRMKERGEKLTTSGVAEAMCVSPASASEMVKRLEKEGYVRHERYKDIELTEKGRKVGRKILGRHRILERFLEGMGLPRRKIHNEACKLEHYVSDELEGLIRRKIEAPRKGKAILSLIDLKNGEKASVFSIDGGAKAVKRLEDMGLTPGTPVTVQRSAPFSGPVEICVRDSCLVIGRGMAGRIFVKVAS